MKKILKKVAIAIVAVNCVVLVSCKKKDNTPAPSQSTGSSVTVAGTSYSASTHLTVATDSTIEGNSFHPTISSTGSFVSYTFTDNSDAPYIYNYFFAQATVTSGDTTFVGFELASLTAIDTGKYVVDPTTYVAKFGAEIYGDDKYPNFNDSIATGTVTVTSINTTSATISGTYSYTIVGAKGSVPSTVTVSSGQFTNVPYQKF